MRRRADRAQVLADTEDSAAEAAAREEAAWEARIFEVRSFEPRRMAPADASEVSEENTLSNESELIPTHHNNIGILTFANQREKIRFRRVL